MAINRLHGMMFRHINQSEINWLKDRRDDEFPAVRALARQVFEEKFPWQARDEEKALLHIKNLAFRARGKIRYGSGDERLVNAEFAADSSGRIVKKAFDESEAILEAVSVEIGEEAIRKFFDAAVHDYDIPFWDIDLDCEFYDDPDFGLSPEYQNGDFFDEHEFVDEGLCGDLERFAPEPGDEPGAGTPAWSVRIEYMNGTEQNMQGYDGMPVPVMMLFCDFNRYFEDDDLGGEFDE